MAIYHLEAKVVSRGTGRSAVAASAYLSCTNILNDYDGVRHDYTRKKGLIWREVFLPEYAPPEWKDRGVLWNAVEENEKTKDSRLAREFVPALPVELTPTQWQELLSDFIKESFVADGMCADVAIHDPSHSNSADALKGETQTEPDKHKHNDYDEPEHDVHVVASCSKTLGMYVRVSIRSSTFLVLPSASRTRFKRFLPLSLSRN